MATPTRPKKDAKPSSTTPSSSGNRWFFVAIIAVVLLGALVVFLAASGRESDIEAEVGTVEIDGDWLPPLDSGDPGIAPADTDPATGRVAPTLTGTAFDDSEVTIGPDGTAKVVYFLAHWCPHCQDEVPVVQDLIDSGQTPDGIELYAVATSTVAGRANFPPSAWLEDEGFTPVTMRDSEANEALLAYGGASFPYVVYLDSEHRVVGRSSGSLGANAILAMWNLTAQAG